MMRIAYSSMRTCRASPSHSAIASRLREHAVTRKCSGTGSSRATPSGIGSWYLYCLERYPIPVKAITAGCMMGGGDCIVQFAIEQSSTLDLNRFCKFFIIGTGLVGPTLHFWYQGLARAFPGTGVATVLKRVAADQFIFAPIFIAVFFSVVALLEGRTLQQLQEQMRLKWFSTLVANWVFWIPVQTLNFAFAPLKLQVLVNNSCGLIWNAYLTSASQRTKQGSSAS